MHSKVIILTSVILFVGGFFSKLLIELMSSSSSIFVLYSSDGGQYQLKYLAPSTSAAPLQLIIATKKYAHPVSDYPSHIWTYTFCLSLTPKVFICREKERKHKAYHCISNVEESERWIVSVSPKDHLRLKGRFSLKHQTSPI